MKTKMIIVAAACLATAASVVEAGSGTVSAGTSVDLDKYRKLYKTAYPANKGPYAVVETALCHPSGYHPIVLAFFNDGTFVEGHSDKLYIQKGTYKLPSGMTPSKVVGIACRNKTLYLWSRDKTLHQASVPALSKLMPDWVNVDKPIDFRKSVALEYQTPPGERTSNIVGMAIDDSNGKVFTFFKNGKRSSGTTTKLGNKTVPYTTAKWKTPDRIVGMAIDGANNFNFAFYQ